MIDPQNQANTWIKNGYKEELQILNFNMESKVFAGVIEGALRNGKIVLIEDVGEILDASLDGVLQKAFFDNNGIKSIRYCDKDVNYDDQFKLFMTSKIPNPHFLPEICIKLTVINFTVTFEGLDEQLLVDVVLHEN